MATWRPDFLHMWEARYLTRHFPLRRRTESKIVEQVHSGIKTSTTSTETLDFDAFADALLDAVILADPDGLVVYVNRIAETSFGYPTGAMIGMNLTELMPERYREGHRRGMQRAAGSRVTPIPGRAVELHGLRKDNTEFPIELSLSSWERSGSTTYIGVVRDLTERRRAERQERTQLAITRLIADSRTLMEAAARVIETIGSSMEWEIGAMWIRDPRNDKLRCSQYWDSYPLRQTNFEKQTLTLQLAHSEGLPGQVWALGRPLWLTDVSVENNFPRKGSASELDLHSAFAFPILDSRSEIAGVLEFFTQEKRAPDKRMMAMMETIGRQIGSLLERTHAIEEVLTIVEQMQVGVLVYKVEDVRDDRSLRVISVNPAAATALGIPAADLVGRLIDEAFPNLRERDIPKLYLGVATTSQSLELDDFIYSDKRVRAAPFSVKAFPLPNGCVGVAFENITKRKSAELLLKAERRILQRAAEGGASLMAILNSITSFASEQTPGTFSTIQLLGGDGKLECVASSGLPEDFTRYLSCHVMDAHSPMALAMSQRDTIIISNIALDERARTIREAAVAYDIRACWATPIVARAGVTVGTVALFSKGEATPTGQELEIMEFASRIAAMIIERYSTEEEGRNNEARFRALIQNSADAIHLHDANRHIIFRSPASQRILGYTDEMLGLPAVDFVHPEDRERLQTQFAGIDDKRTPVESTFRARHRDGRWIWLEAQVSNQLDDPILHSIVVNFRDVTDRYIAEMTLRESEERFNSFTNNAPLVAFIKDEQSRYVWINEEFTKYFDLPLERVTGKSDLELFDRETAEENFANDAAVLQRNAPTTSTGTMVTADGIERTFMFIKFPLRLSSGASQIGGVAIDLTERNLLEKQLERSERISSLGRLAANIAHEINNVLMGILPFAELIKRSSSDDKQLRAASHILNSVERGKRITQDILRFTRASEPVMRPFNCRTWIEEMVPELHSLLGDVKLAIELPPSDLFLRGDPMQLQQVLTNLALNARDAMENRGRLTIAVSACSSDSPLALALVPNPEGFTHITVADTGKGIPEEIMDRIFEPMFTTKSHGTGLGLAITHQVISTHGGKIQVESSPNSGTTFHLVLPCAAGATEVSRPTADAVRPIVERVLLVEDDEAVGEGIRVLLESDGIEVRWVKTGAEAAEAVAEFGPDILVLDVGLPDLDGLELYKKLSVLHPLLPTIFSSGHGENSPIEEFTDRPVTRLMKPYDYETLLGTIAAVIRGNESA